jgi:hypothetical protein
MSGDAGAILAPISHPTIDATVAFLRAATAEDNERRVGW